MDEPQPARLRALLAWGCVLAGAGIRVHDFIWGRALWLDEILLGLNVVDHGFARLARPLDYDQGAPIGFLWLHHLSVKVFGSNEYALRLVPLLAGIGALVLVVRIAHRLLSPPAALVAVALCAFNPALIYYSTEAKQYSMDVLVVLAVVALALPCLDQPTSGRAAFRFGLVGGVLVWFAHPAVFALAGASAVLVGRPLLRRDRPVTLLWLTATWLWATSFAAEYAVSLRPVAKNRFLHDYWEAQDGFPSGGIAGMFRWLGRTATAVFEVVPRLHLGAIALVVALIGLAVLARRRPWGAAVVAAPLVLGVGAAVVSAYPMRDRLALYTVPLVMLAMAAALDLTWPVLRAVAAPLLVVLVFVSAESTEGVLDPSKQTRQYEDSRAVLEVVKARWQPGDALYVPVIAEPAFEYYGRPLAIPLSGSALFTYDRKLCASPSDLSQVGSESGRIWLFLAHRAGPGAPEDWTRYEAWFGALGGKVTDTIDRVGSRAVLYDGVHPGAGRTSEVPDGCLGFRPTYWWMHARS